MPLCSMISFSFLRAIHEVFFRSMPHFLLCCSGRLSISINTNTQSQTHTLLSPKWSLASKVEMKRVKKSSFIKCYIFALCFKTGPKITVTIYGGSILITELRNLYFVLETSSIYLDIIIIIIANRKTSSLSPALSLDHFGQYFQALVPKRGNNVP